MRALPCVACLVGCGHTTPSPHDGAPPAAKRDRPPQVQTQASAGDAGPEDALPVRTPAQGLLYHGVFPGSASDPGSEDAIVGADVEAYEHAVGHRAAWVYFSHEWAHGEAFPMATAKWIRARGSVPFVRLMLRTVPETARTTRETRYSLASIAAGKHDAALGAWGGAAKRFGTPILAEWGTEMNGEWFPWNASHNGRAAGTALFRVAYRHIVEVVRSSGARNVMWTFHVNGDDQPTALWNRFEEYYPGDDVVDWLGFSAYGAQTPDGPCQAFASYADPVVSRLGALSPGKPIFVLEFGTTANARRCAAVDWARHALDAILSGRWPSLHGFAWWNERWDNGDGRVPTDMRIQAAPGLAKVFRSALGSGAAVERPIAQ